MRVRVRFAWREESDQTLMKLAGISMVAHIFGLILFSTLPRFMETPPAPRATIAEIIPASALMPPAPPGPPPRQAGPTPSERAEAAKKALEPEPPPVPKPKPKEPDKPKPPKPSRKDIPPLEEAKPEKKPEAPVVSPDVVSGEPEAPSEAPTGPPAPAAGPGGIRFGETAPGPGGVPTIGSSAFPYDYYRASLVAILQSHWRRPVAPGGIREPIGCRVQFTILKSGIIQDPRIAVSSGDPRLDQSALRAVVSSNPLPPLPFQYGHTSVSAEVMFELTPD